MPQIDIKLRIPTWAGLVVTRVCCSMLRCQLKRVISAAMLMVYAKLVLQRQSGRWDIFKASSSIRIKPDLHILRLKFCDNRLIR